MKPIIQIKYREQKIELELMVGNEKTGRLREFNLKEILGILCDSGNSKFVDLLHREYLTKEEKDLEKLKQ